MDFEIMRVDSILILILFALIFFLYISYLNEYTCANNVDPDQTAP